MNILVNFLPVNSGGGLQNAVNFWRLCLTRNDGARWICIVRRDSVIASIGGDECHVVVELPVPDMQVARPLFDNIVIKRIAKKYGIDVVFTLVGPGPCWGAFKRFNGWHEPHMVYPESVYWKRISVFRKWMLKIRYQYATYSLRRADRVSVQTLTMRKRLSSMVGIGKEKIVVIPNGISSFCDEEHLSPSHTAALDSVSNRIKLLVLCEPYVHKNLSYVIELSFKLPRDFVFIMSFNEATSEAGRIFVEEVRKRRTENTFLFIGKVEFNELKKLYEAVDGVFVPTLLESFSANYVEAMYYKKPLFVSDADFSRELCNGYALFFDPLNVDSARAVLENYYFDEHFRATTKSMIANYRLKFPDWKTRFDMYYLEIRSLMEDKNAHGGVSR